MLPNFSVRKQVHPITVRSQFRFANRSTCSPDGWPCELAAYFLSYGEGRLSGIASTIFTPELVGDWPQPVVVVGGVVAVVDCFECSASSAWLVSTSALEVACQKVVFTSCAFHSIFAWALLKKNTQNAMHAGGAMRHPTSSGGHSQPSDPAVLHSKQRPLPLGVSLVGHLYERHFVCTGEI